MPLQDRLCSCSLVCQRFRAAAAAATQHIKTNCKAQQQRVEGLLEWLKNHQHVTSLEVFDCPRLVHLPCPNLVELELLCCDDVQLVASDNSSQQGVLHSCSSTLTKLALNDCTFVVGQAGLDALSCLVNLQHLWYERGEAFDDSDDCVDSSDDEAGRGGVGVSKIRQTFATFPGSVLQSLVQLTHLQLQLIEIEGLQHLSCLSKLCELNLTLHNGCRLTPNIARGFELPASLQRLLLDTIDHFTVLDPALLHTLTALEVLDITRALLTATGGVESGAALLDALPALQQLRCLKLSSVDADWPPASSPSYSALVPSSTLTSLHIVGRCLQDGALQHTFTPDRVLPQLRHVLVSVDVRSSASEPLHAYAWDSTVLGSIASCCPGLQALECRLQQGVSVEPLGQLTELTALTCQQAGSVEEARASMQAASVALKQLQELRLTWSLGVGRLEREVLRPLTALRKLTSLSCWQADVNHTLRHHVIGLDSKVGG